MAALAVYAGSLGTGNPFRFNRHARQ